MPGLDVRVNTDLLTDPAWLRLSDSAVAALLSLQLYALSRDSDGFVGADAYTPQGNYHGLRSVNAETLSELEEAGFLFFEDGGVQVEWEGQTTARQREELRARKRGNQAKKRERDRENAEIAATVRPKKSPPLPRSKSVTGDAPVTHRGLGKDRTGIGQEEGDVQPIPLTVPSFPDTDPPTRKLSREERQAEAVRLNKEGLSLREIGKQLGCSKDTVSSDLKQAEHPVNSLPPLF